MLFFVGLHQPHDCRHFDRCMVSIKRLVNRRSDFAVADWLLDSGAFTELALHGHYRQDVDVYARAIRRWAGCGRLLAAVSQDYMCESFILAQTGLTVAEHQRLTIERYDALHALVPATYIMPVLQGYRPSEYVEHIRQYGERLQPGMWVGVGSVCKRNADVGAIERVLMAIKTERPDLRCHGFGIKATALESSYVRSCLYSADSMAWSFAARRNGGNANAWQAAAAFVTAIEQQRVRQRAVQMHLFAGASGRGSDTMSGPGALTGVFSVKNGTAFVAMLDGFRVDTFDTQEAAYYALARHVAGLFLDDHLTLQEANAYLTTIVHRLFPAQRTLW